MVVLGALLAVAAGCGTGRASYRPVLPRVTEGGGLRAEVAHSVARQALDMARKPLAEAERRAQRLDTEAKTLAKLLHVETKNLWPAVIDQLTVEKGYEAALGAALGDDLEAPVEPSAPMRWAGADIDPGDPALPGNALPLSQLGFAGKRLRFRAHLGEVAAVALDLAAHLRKLGLDALRGRKLSERVLGLAASRRGLLAIGFDARLRLGQG